MISRIFEKLGRHRSTETSASTTMRFVDLGLPSSTLWADSDVEDAAIEGCSLPTYEQVESSDIRHGTHIPLHQLKW
jgi:hypothetical protein